MTVQETPVSVPADAESFRFVLRQFVRKRGDVARVAEILGTRQDNLSKILSGDLAPSQFTANDWPKKLEGAGFDLDEICTMTGLTLRVMLERSMATLPRTVGRPAADINEDILRLLWEISGRPKAFISAIAHSTGRPEGLILKISSHSEVVSRRLLTKFIFDLSKAFPERDIEIRQLSLLLLSGPHASAAKVKRAMKAEKVADNREMAGLLMETLCKACGYEIADAEKQIVDANRDNWILKGNLARTAAGDMTLPASIFGTAIREVCDFCENKAPENVKPYISTLKQIGRDLQPR